MLKQWILSVAVISFSALAVHAHAEEPKQMGKQQSKMAECNKTAGEKQLKGDDRKAFMSTCLKKKPTQQEKMGLCNKEAGEKQLKGDERKAFMSSCLKG